MNLTQVHEQLKCRFEQNLIKHAVVLCAFKFLKSVVVNRFSSPRAKRIQNKPYLRLTVDRWAYIILYYIMWDVYRFE